jgi:osmoprotectant transport system substrate-binding protein
MKTTMKKSLKSSIALSAVAILGLAGCAESNGDQLVIGS